MSYYSFYRPTEGRRLSRPGCSETGITTVNMMIRDVKIRVLTVQGTGIYTPTQQKSATDSVLLSRLLYSLMSKDEI